MRLKLCYVLPKYDLNTEEHFYHNYQFLEELGKEVELFLIIERGVGEPQFKHMKKVYKQKFIGFLPLRILEIALLMLGMRMGGIKTFYVHYSYFGGLIGSLLCKLTGGKIYYWHCVSVIYKTKWAFNFQDLLHKVKAEVPLKLTLRVVDYLVTGTESLGDFYHQTFGIPKKKIIILPNEIDLNRFNLERYDRRKIREKLGINPEEKAVLFVHRVVERKGAHHLPEIAKKVNEEIPQAKFLVAGNGPYFETLKSKIAEAGLNSKVNLLGWVPNRKIMGLYAGADVFIMPSEEEGFPRVLLESMAMGVPFVATDVGGVRDICSEGQKKFIVPVKDNLSFAEKMILLLQSQPIYEALKDEGLDHVQRFSSEKVKERFMKEIMIKRENERRLRRRERRSS